MNRTQFAYNKRAEAFEEKFAAYQVYINQIKTFSELIADNSSILDLGCGPGLNARLFTDRGHSVTGIDLSETMIERARKNCPGGIFHHGSVLDLPLEETYDALCLSFIIVHLNDEQTELLLSGLKRISRKGTCLYISFMPGKTEGYERTSFSEYEIYFNYHSEDRIITLLNQNGFHLISKESEPYENSDGSVMEDLFLTFRYKEG